MLKPQYVGYTFANQIYYTENTELSFGKALKIL